MPSIAVPDGMRLDADPAAVAAARAYVSGQCGALPDDAREEARVVVSELVANSVRHARTDVVVGVEIDGGVVRVHVADRSPDPPHPRSAGLFDEGGRGLLMVDTLAVRWGVVVSDDGKRVWAEIPIERRDL